MLYIDGRTIPGSYGISMNVNLTGVIVGEDSAMVTVVNHRSSDINIAKATIINPNSSGYVSLNITKVSLGPVSITFDYKDVHGTM